MPSHKREVVVEEAGIGLRLDKYISEVLALLPRSQIEKRNLVCCLASKPAKPLKLSYKMVGGEALVLTWDEPPPPDYQAENIPLNVVFENKDTVVLNKPRGMVVHPAHGNHTGTLVQGLLYRVEELRANFPGELLRPGIVHRLDKDTTGLIITAKTPAALDFLAAQFRAKTTEKTYFAVLQGRLPAEKGRLTTQFGRDPQDRKKFAVWAEGGKVADTLYRVRAVSGNYSLVQLSPRTGRTHQLRVHMAHLRAPILGDPVYGHKDKLVKQAPLLLHSRSLKILLPGEGEARLFKAEFPADFLAVVDKLGLTVGLPAPVAD